MNWTALQSWEKLSDRLFVHVTGAKIERRGYPLRYGWYLLPADPLSEPIYFDASPAGCDQAFIAFAAGYGGGARLAG